MSGTLSQLDPALHDHLVVLQCDEEMSAGDTECTADCGERPILSGLHAVNVL